MAQKWKDKDSARTMTNKYNEVVDELNEVTQISKSFDSKIEDRLTSAESDFDAETGAPSPTSSLIRVKGTIPAHPYEQIIEENSFIHGKYAAIGGSILFEDGSTRVIDNTFEIYTKPDGLYIKTSSWREYQGSEIVVLLVEIPDIDDEENEEVDDDE